MPANKRDMGMVFQAYSLFPHLTVRDNVAFGLQLRGQDRSRRLARVPRDARAGRPRRSSRTATPTSSPAASSSGSRWPGRWPSSRAVLLLDEPLSALDAKVRVQLRDEIRRVQLDVGTTTLFVTHDQEEALAVADRVGVMNAGPARPDRAAHRALRPPRDPVRRGVRRPQQPDARPTCPAGAATLLGAPGPAARRLGRARRRAGAGAAGVGGRHGRADADANAPGRLGGVPRPVLPGPVPPRRRPGRRRPGAQLDGRAPRAGAGRPRRTCRRTPYSSCPTDARSCPNVPDPRSDWPIGSRRCHPGRSG